jgi:hypothetical protein
MQPVPRIFVSATSRDLRTARGLVSEGLRRMECLPIVQDDFPPDYKSVRDMLRTKILTCDAVVHLAGFYYGAEPQPVIPGPDRRSFTQMEYEIAMELKLPVYVFLCGKDFPFDPHDPEPEDKQQLQLDHRGRLLQREELYYEFASPEELSTRTRELQLSVENLREELARERSRRRMTLGVAVAAIVIALGGGAVLLNRQGAQEKVIAATSLKLEQQGALIEQLLAEQARLRQEGATDPRAIALAAEKNVAAANNQSVEEIRSTLDQAIAEAQQAVDEARAGKTGLASAFRRAAEKSAKGKLVSGSNSDLAAALDRLAGAQLAAGHVNEAIAAQAERFALLDRDKDPEVWTAAAVRVAAAMRDRDVMSIEPRKILGEALEWAQKNPDLGPEHPATLSVMAGYARTLVSADITQSIALNQEVYDVRKRTLGQDAPGTVEAAMALARALGIAGSDGDKAATARSEKIFRQLVASAQKTHGPNAPETAEAMGELARCLRYQEQFEESEALYRQVRTIYSKALGPDDERTLTAVSKLAFLREDQDDYPGAIALVREILAAEQKKLGPEAGDTLMTTQILAGILGRSGEPANEKEAETLFRSLLETRIRTVGPAQPDTLTAYDKLADFLEERGDKDEALQLRLTRLDAQGKAVGSDDTGYAVDLMIVAREAFSADQDQTAQSLAKKALAIREAKLGETDPKTLDAMELVSVIAKTLGDTGEAEELARRVVTIRRSKVADDVPALAGSYDALARVLAAADRPAEALPFARRAVALAAEALPEDNEDRQDIEETLADIAQDVTFPADFAALRDEWKAKCEDGGPWKGARLTLPGNSDARKLYLLGWTNGDTLMRMMEADASSDTDGTYSFYYWNTDGDLLSVVRIREGSATGTEGVAKIADTFNFADGTLVEWTERIDGEEATVDPISERFATVAQNISKAVAQAAKTFSEAP